MCKTTGCKFPLLRFFVFLTLAFKLFTRHTRSEYSIPMNKKGLREIRLDSNDLIERGVNEDSTRSRARTTYLMMNVMIICIVS